MKLYGSLTSPFVRHCRVALAQTGQKFDFVLADHAASLTGTPTHRVPYAELADGTLLHDSAAILKAIREQAGQPFFADVQDYDLFCLANTLLDTQVNLFLLNKDGVTAEQSSYVARQASRIEATLAALEARQWQGDSALTDGELRLACYLSWASFRQLLDLQAYPNLRDLLARADQQPLFANTHPAMG